jgi:putative ABC transport system permease protein
MVALADTVTLAMDALRAHKLRAALTILGLTMGVATLIAVMTLIQGANVYVEQKVARLGTDVFQIARTPFTVTDFNLVIKSLRYKRFNMDDTRAVAEACRHCALVGATASSTARTVYEGHDLEDTSMIGETPSMAAIDTREVTQGRFFNDIEDRRASNVCVLGDGPLQEFFGGVNPVGKKIRVAGQEFTVIGAFEKIGSILGQDQDNYVVVPMTTYLHIRGMRSSVTINAKARVGALEPSMDETRLMLRARRHIAPTAEEDFFIGTKDSYIEMWQSISAAFFAVFIMVSSISAVVGGIVIMNVMLVSVTERTKEIGVRRAIGASQQDILRQFLTESVLQCVAGGAVGIGIGFACALVLRTFTEFPASVQTWVAVLGLVLSSAIGLFFGIYPATRAARLDPVVALRSE